MTSGDIHWVTLPPQPGHIQSGRRPCLVLQDENAGKDSPLVIIAPFTTSLTAARFGPAVEIDPSPENGLPIRSLVMVFQLHVVERHDIGRFVGRINETILQAIFEKLDELTGRK